MIILWIFLLSCLACIGKAGRPKRQAAQDIALTQATQEHIRSLQRQAAFLGLQATRETDQDKKARLYAQSTSKALQAQRLIHKLKAG